MPLRDVENKSLSSPYTPYGNGIKITEISVTVTSHWSHEVTDTRPHNQRTKMSPIRHRCDSDHLRRHCGSHIDYRSCLCCSAIYFEFVEINVAKIDF